MSKPFTPIEYLAPECFTSGGLHFSPLAMEVSVNVGGDWIALAPISPEGAEYIAPRLDALKEGCISEGATETGLPEINNEFIDRVGATCLALGSIAQNSVLDAGEWELHLARHGTDDWPPAIQSSREGILDAAADIPEKDLASVGTLVWQHAISRCMGTDRSIVDDRQFFEAGLPAMCPNARLKTWGDLTQGGRREKALSIV